MVVTHRRPRLATAAVRHLIEDEGLDPRQVVVVVNGQGGLDDPDLEAAVRMVRLVDNLGPAGGFHRGILEAFADPATRWAYLCEDDITLAGLPNGRLGDLLERIAAYPATAPVGAVCAFGRMVVGRSGHTRNVVPRRGLPGELAPVDLTMWGATLLSRRVVEAGVLPDPELFFGFEDFDFFSSMRAAGFSLLVDVVAARKVAGYQTLAGRDKALVAERPTDSEEPWRAYYFARNFFALARRHGRRSWIAWHLLYSLRRLQLAHGAAERMAIVRGLWDGARGRMGRHPRYVRSVGEKLVPEPPQAPTGVVTADEPDDRASVASLAGGTLAMIVTHNAPGALARCVDAVAGQSTPPAAVLVVDNGSEPPVRAEALDRPGQPLTVVRSEQNTGPAGGWARAFTHFAAGQFPLAWVLDDDIVPDPDCLEVLLGDCAAEPERAFCFPRSVQPDGSVGEWGAWCGFVIARGIVDEVGVPKAELFWWAEDNEYTHWRIPTAGHRRRIVEGAMVQHDAIRQVGPVPTWKYYYEARNMLYLHLHLMRRVGWYPRNLSKLLGRALLRERGRRVRSLVAIGRGLADGATGRLGLRFPVEPMHERRFPVDEVAATPRAAPSVSESVPA